MAGIFSDVGFPRVFAVAEHAACHRWYYAVSGPALCGVGRIAHGDMALVEHDLFFFGLPGVQ